MIKIKLELKERDELDIIAFGKTVGSKITTNSNFPSPPVAGSVITADAVALEGLIQTRASLDVQLLQNTLNLRTARDKLDLDLNLTGAYVEQGINTAVPLGTPIDPVAAAVKALSAGLQVVSAPTPVGPMPKIQGLRATQGDANGEVDLHWNPVKRGLRNYIMEMTDDPAGLTGWQHIGAPTKSSMTATGLTSGKRYWFRVTANGSAGPGPASEATTKVAP